MLFTSPRFLESAALKDSMDSIWRWARNSRAIQLGKFTSRLLVQHDATGSHTLQSNFVSRDVVVRFHISHALCITLHTRHWMGWTLDTPHSALEPASIWVFSIDFHSMTYHSRVNTRLIPCVWSGKSGSHGVVKPHFRRLSGLSYTPHPQVYGMGVPPTSLQTSPLGWVGCNGIIDADINPRKSPWTLLEYHHVNIIYLSRCVAMPLSYIWQQFLKHTMYDFWTHLWFGRMLRPAQSSDTHIPGALNIIVTPS